jgi:WD40 repeat protein
VPPDRPCYIRREADEELIDAVSAQRFAYVLAARAMGKSSVMGRTIRRLRADGKLAAVVDLSQIGSRGESIDAARWHYSIAYRISRELRIRVDLQSWWQDRTLLPNERRLLEFFQDVVLARTDVPVTIFFDAVEQAIELPFSRELYVALHGSLMRRASDPEFARLSFVVLGAATPEQLCPDTAVSPFVSGVPVALRDFTPSECAALAPGLGRSGAAAELVLARIHAWTRGQPFLTQKLARAIARRGSRSEDVDNALHELFFAPGTAHEEPLLNHMRRMLTGNTPRARQAVAILGRLSRSQEVIQDSTSPAQQLLNLAGLIGSDDNGMLRYRNPIAEQVFDAEFVREHAPRRWQHPAALAAAGVVAVLVLGFAYLRVLPAGAIETLRASTDYAEVEDAHARLGRLPGFGSMADELLAVSMERRGADAVSIAEVRAAGDVLRRLPGGAAQADDLLAAYWLRQAEGAASRGDRDGALLFALEAAAGGSPAASGLAENLIDGDYRRLGGSLHLAARPLDVAVDWQRNVATVVDATHRVQRLPLASDDPGVTMPASPMPQPLPARLTALQQVGVTRSLFVDTRASGGAFELDVAVEHERPSDLLLRLRGPDGSTAMLELPQGSDSPFVIAASTRNGLRRLAADSVTGQWELTVYDREAGVTGRLLSWGLRFTAASRPFVDAPVDGLLLPDPQRTEQVDVALADDGRLAVATPSRVDARGAASIWDLTTGERIADLPLEVAAASVDLIATGRLLVAGTDGVVLWDTVRGAELARFDFPDGFAAPPELSADERFLAIAESAGESARVTLLAVDDGSTIGSFETESWSDWSLAPEARTLALVDGSRRGRVLDPRTGTTIAEFFHERALTRVLAGGADRVVAVDDSGGVVAWTLPAAGGALGPQDSRILGTTVSPRSVAVAVSGQALAYLDPEGFITVLDPGTGLHQQSLGHGEAANLRAMLSPEGDRLVSWSGALLRYWDLGAAAPGGPDFGSVSAVALDARGEIGMLGLRGGQVGLLPGLPAAAATGRASEAILAHRGSVTRLALTANGELAASGSSDGVVRVWNTGTGTRSPVVLRHPVGPIEALAFSPDNRWLVSAAGNSVRVFELASGELEREIETEGLPLAIAVAADSRLVAVGDSAGSIYLAPPDSRIGVQTIRGRAAITALAFGGTSERLASGSDDGDLVLWDTVTASAIEPARRYPGPIRWIEIADDAGSVWLQSGVWLHRLDRSVDPPVVVASRLLPELLRVSPAFGRVDGTRVRGLASRGGGRLALADLTLGPTGSAALLPDRDFSRVLGLRLDPATGAVEKSFP